jgi:hypothetical protein
VLFRPILQGFQAKPSANYPKLAIIVADIAADISMALPVAWG